MFPSHAGMKLEINNKKFGTFTKMRKLSNTLSITNGSKNKTTREIRKYFEMKENENTLTKIYGRKLKQWRIFALSVLFEILKNAFKGNQFFKVCNCRKLVNSSLNGWMPSGSERLNNFLTVTALVSGDSAEPRTPSPCINFGSSRISSFSIIHFLFFFQLEDNCFRILCWPLPYLNMNQPQVYISPSLLSPPPMPHPIPPL